MFAILKGTEENFQTWSSDVSHQVQELKRFEKELKEKMGYVLACHTHKNSHIFMPMNFNLLNIKTDFLEFEFNKGINRKILGVVNSLLYLGRIIGGFCMIANNAIGGELGNGKELILDLDIKEIEGLKPHKFSCKINKARNTNSLVYEEVVIPDTGKYLKHFVWTRVNKKKLSYGVVGWIKEENIFYFGSTSRPGYGFDTEKIERIFCYQDIGSL